MKAKKPETERQCRFCEMSAPLRDEEFVLCEKRGIVRAAYCCRKFRYDPLKRDPGAIPPPPLLDFIPIDDEETPTVSETAADANSFTDSL